jgi:hypothetical protein
MTPRKLEPRFRCTSCGEYVEAPDGLNGHTRTEHTADGPIPIHCGPVVEEEK